MNFNELTAHVSGCPSLCLKKCALVACLLASTFLLNAQMWDRRYSEDYFDIVASAPNGDIIGATEVYGPLGIKVARLDKEGNVLWIKTYLSDTSIVGSDTKPYFMGLASLRDGSIVVEFRQRIRRPASPFLHKMSTLLKIDPRQGNLIWKKTTPQADIKFNRMLVTSDNNILNLEQNDFSLSGPPSVSIVKLTADGDTIWRKKIEGAIRHDAFFEKTDKSILAILTKSASNKVYLIKINPQTGNDIPILELEYHYVALATTADNGIIVYDALGLTKYDALMRNQWTVPAPIAPHFFGHIILTPTKDNGIVIGEGVENHVAKVDSSGQLLWNRRVGDDRTGIYDIITTPDNGLLLNSLSVDSANNYRLRLIKTNGDGKSRGDITGRVRYAENCTIVRDNPVLKNWYVQAVGANNETYSIHTDSLGRFRLGVDSIPTTLSALPYNNKIWKNCYPLQVAPALRTDTATTIDLLVTGPINCPAMSIDMTGNRLRRCFSDNYLSVSYVNNGTATAKNVRIEVTLDSLLEYVSSTAVLGSRMGQKLIFNLGNVAVFENNSFEINTRVRCGDSTSLNQTLCSSAKIFPDSICTLPVNWSGANLTIQGRCDADSVRFVIANTANVATTPFLQRTVIRNDSIVQLIGTTLPRNGSLTLGFPKNGSTWRVNQIQEPNNPRNVSVTAVVEGCRLNSNTALSYGFVNQFTNATGDPSVSVACLPIIGAYDPNEKFAVPEGVKAQHFIEPNTDIDYQIGFQNTGTDTAFTVVLRDTLSNDLDPATIKMLNASTTKYSWDMVSKNELKISFNNILLPDSFRNEPRSHGFVKFRISQKRDVAIGTRIENRAAIYFDYNAPIITNKTFHTIGKNFLSTAVEQVFADNLQVQVTPNPISQQAIFKLPNSMNEPLVFELFDVTGKRMRQETHQSPTFIFQRNDLQNGLYLFKINAKASNKFVMGKIVLN